MEHLYNFFTRFNFFTFSYIHNNFNLNDFEKSKRIYETIIDEEIKNGMPEDIAAHGKKTFLKDMKKLIGKNIITHFHLILVH